MDPVAQGLARHVDPAASSTGACASSTCVSCLHLPAHIGARLNASSCAYAVLPCLHAADCPDVHGSGALLASSAVDSLNLRGNALTTLVEDVPSQETPTPASLQASRVPQSTPLRFFHHLLALDLNNNQLRGLDGIEVLPQLLSLRVAHNKLETLSSLWRAPCAARLDVLDVTGNCLSSLLSRADAATLASASPSLRVLYAADNRVCDVEEVFTCFAELDDVRLRRNAIREVPVAAIIASGAVKSLRYLDLSENPLSSRAMQVLKAKQPPALELVVSSPAATPPDVELPLQSSPKRRSVKKEPPPLRARAGSSSQPGTASSLSPVAPSPQTPFTTTGHDVHHKDNAELAEQNCAQLCSPHAPSLPSSASASPRRVAPAADTPSTSPARTDADVSTPREEQPAAAPVSLRGARRVVITTPRTGTHYTPSDPLPLTEVHMATQGTHAPPAAEEKKHEKTEEKDNVTAARKEPPSRRVSLELPPLGSATPATASSGQGAAISAPPVCRLPTTSVDPRTGVNCLAENTYAIDVKATFEAFEHNVLHELLRGGGGGDALAPPSPAGRQRLVGLMRDAPATSAVLARVANLHLVFQTEIYQTVPTLVLTNITPDCTRATVMGRLFVAHLLHSLKMEEEAARTRLLRTRPNAATAMSEGRRSTPNPRGGTQPRGLASGARRSSSDAAAPPAADDAPCVVPFSNSSEDAPPLRVVHVFVDPDRSDAARGVDSVAHKDVAYALFYLRWRREWEVAVSRRKLVVEDHYFVHDSLLLSHDVRDAAGGSESALSTDGRHVSRHRRSFFAKLPGCASIGLHSHPVPPVWSRLYTQLVLERGDGSMINTRKGRRARSRRKNGDERDGLEKALYERLAGHDDGHEEAEEEDMHETEGDGVPVVKARRPPTLPALQRPLLDVVKPLSSMHSVAPRWTCELVENYAAVRATGANAAGSSGANNNSPPSASIFARSISSVSSGRSHANRSTYASPASPSFSAPTLHYPSTSPSTASRVTSAPLALAELDYIAQASALCSTQMSLVAKARSDAAQHAMAQVVDSPFTFWEADEVMRNRAQRNALWARCRAAQQKTIPHHTHQSSASQGEEEHTTCSTPTSTSQQKSVANKRDVGEATMPAARTLESHRDRTPSETSVSEDESAGLACTAVFDEHSMVDEADEEGETIVVIPTAVCHA